MKLTKDFGVNRKTRELWFEYTATVSGKMYHVQHRAAQREFGINSPPLEIIWEQMRRNLMRAIEQDLFYCEN